MNKKAGFVCFATLLIISGNLHAQYRKLDSTVKMNDKGFRVQCSNKDSDQNEISISPVGFKITQRDVIIPVKGRVTKVAIDDLNEDGNPDLVIYIYSGVNGAFGTVMGISSTKDQTLEPIYFPDLYIDPKLRNGYKGHDEFSLVIGTLLRKFPLYLPGDALDKPTGGRRTVQYKVMNQEGHQAFKVIRSFDTKPEE